MARAVGCLSAALAQVHFRVCVPLSAVKDHNQQQRSRWRIPRPSVYMSGGEMSRGAWELSARTVLTASGMSLAQRFRIEGRQISLCMHRQVDTRLADTLLYISANPRTRKKVGSAAVGVLACRFSLTHSTCSIHRRRRAAAPLTALGLPRSRSALLPGEPSPTGRPLRASSCSMSPLGQEH